MTCRSPRSTSPLRSVSASVPWSLLTASSPPASSCRTTPRHSASRSSPPIPKTDSLSCPYDSTRGVLRPSRMSIGCPAPNEGPPSRSSRTTADSSFCAATVPSHTEGGDRHVSQLPHGPAAVSPK